MIHKNLQKNNGFTPPPSFKEKKNFLLRFFRVPNYKNKINLVEGFTLVETMFAVFILTFVIVGLMTVVSSSLFSARYARDEITANYLAQEVVDYIRNDRDTKVFLKGNNWATFVDEYSKCEGNNNSCYFDVFDVLDDDSVTIKSCPSDGCPVLYYDNNATKTPFYLEGGDSLNKDGKTVTKFTRTIETAQPNDNELVVTVTISWKNGSITKERVLKTSLTNWQLQ